MLSTLSGRFILVVSLALVAFLQYKLWWGESGYYDRKALKESIAAQQVENDQLAERNRILSAEVYDLKSGLEAVEEHARLDLGLIKPNETFVQMSVLPASPAATASAGQNVAAVTSLSSPAANIAH